MPLEHDLKRAGFKPTNEIADGAPLTYNECDGKLVVFDNQSKPWREVSQVNQQTMNALVSLYQLRSEIGSTSISMT